MIIPDLNLLLYAIDESSPQHDSARTWLAALLSGTETVAFPWVVVLGFVRLATNPRVFVEPLDVADAMNIVRGWLAQPNATTVNPAARHLETLRDLLVPVGTAGNLTTDGHLAALAIENGAELHSADTDFGRFPNLAWMSPL